MGCGCGKGGGNKTVSIKGTDGSSPSNNMNSQDDVVLMEYLGSDTNKVTLRSRVSPRDKYSYSKDEPRFLANLTDVSWLLSLGIFNVIKESLVDSTIVNELLPLESNTMAPDFSNIPVDVLPIDPTILANLKKNGYDKLERVKLASDGELLALKGMGDKRLKDLRLALNGV